MNTHCFKTTVLLSAVLLLFACNKDAKITLQEEALISTDNELFVSITNATDIATLFFGSLSNNPTTKSKSRLASTETILNSKNTNEPLMYVINYTDGGFVIVGATKNYYPILAYSSENSFILNEDMGGLVVWLEETKEAIRQSEALEEETKSEMRNLWRYYELKNNNITTSLKTKSYDPAQEAAFQARIEELQNGLGSDYQYYRLSDVFYSGDFPDTYDAYIHYCDMANNFGSPLEYTIVGLAGGYNLNEVGPLLTTHWQQYDYYNLLCLNYPGPAGCGTIAEAQIMKFHQFPTTYNWSGMPNTLATNATQVLIRDIHSRLGSSTTVDTERAAFQYFGYNATIHNHNSQSVHNEIFNNKKPILMGGYPSSFLGFPTGDGHSWVCDGTSYSYYHMNYFIEFLTGGSGNYSYTNLDYAPSLEYPVNVNGGSSSYFHMNWGWGPSSQTPNAWYSSNNVATHLGNFQYVRENIYVSK